MAHKTLIGSTAYEIKGGKTLIDGTAYKIESGKTLVDGTTHDIGFNVTIEFSGNGGYRFNVGPYAGVRLDENSTSYSYDFEDTPDILGNYPKTVYEFPIGYVLKCRIMAYRNSSTSTVASTITINGQEVARTPTPSSSYGVHAVEYDYVIRKNATVSLSCTNVSSQYYGTIVIQEY